MDRMNVASYSFLTIEAKLIKLESVTDLSSYDKVLLYYPDKYLQTLRCV